MIARQRSGGTTAVRTGCSATRSDPHRVIVEVLGALRERPSTIANALGGQPVVVFLILFVDAHTQVYRILFSRSGDVFLFGPDNPLRRPMSPDVVMAGSPSEVARMIADDTTLVDAIRRGAIAGPVEVGDVERVRVLASLASVALQKAVEDSSGAHGTATGASG